MTTTRRNLVVCPMGDSSVHRTWLSDAGARQFDLMLIYYGNQVDFGRQDADYYVQRRGFKWELLAAVLDGHSDVFERYDRVWCPDNDIAADTHQVNHLFKLFEHYQLQLAQPAISKGEVSYQALRQRPGVVLRYTPYVEVMCPLFTREALLRVAPTFGESRSGWGLDWVWPRWFEHTQRAIIDAVGVEHTGMLFRGEHYRELAKLGIDPGGDFERVIQKFGGFDRRVHKAFVRGTIRLPAIWDPAAPKSLFWRAAGRLGIERRAA